MVVVRDIISLLNDLAPWRLAEDWDNCGLMVGHMDHPVTKAALALDATLETVTQARDAGAQVLLTHHPLIFKPLKRIDLSQESAKVAASAIEAGIAIISAHTNLDASTVGVARALAQKLELKDVEVLEATRGGFFKLVVFVPLGYENPIRESVLSIGAGVSANMTDVALPDQGRARTSPARIQRLSGEQPGILNESGKAVWNSWWKTGRYRALWRP
jgi:dinuclear metal center YbgI/SA1388 family protein